MELSKSQTLEKKRELLEREFNKAIKHHSSYRGRNPYYPFNMDQWTKDLKEIPKKYDALIKDIDVQIENLDKADTKGPTCAICLDDMYSTDGNLNAVSFNPVHCKRHIFHRKCASHGNLSKCPICRDSNKKLTNIDKSNLRTLSKNSPSPTSLSPKKSIKAKRKPRCPKGTRRNPKNNICETRNNTQQKKRCPNGTRKNKKTGNCE